jgi:hypothetical protein
MSQLIPELWFGRSSTELKPKNTDGIIFFVKKQDIPKYSKKEPNNKLIIIQEREKKKTK